MTVPTSTSTEAGEWQLLTSFQSHRHRLKDSMLYMPLDAAAAQTPIVEINLQNQTEFLEDALRRIMRRDDTSSYLDSGKTMGAGTMAEAKALLKMFWAVLEDMVDVELLQRSRITSKTEFGKQQYFKLDALLDVLAVTDWDFGMASGMSVTLFHSKDISVIEKANMAADGFNAFLDRQNVSSVRDFPAPYAPEIFEDEGTGAPVDEMNVSLLQEAVQILFSALKTDCEQDHKVLMQLRSLEEVISSGGHVSEPALELFLSSCLSLPRRTSGLRWKESLLSLPARGFRGQGANDWWRRASRLCDEIHNSVSRREGLLLAASEREIHVFEGRVDHSITTNRPTWRKKPSRTLKQLMKDLAFVEYYIPARDTVPFTKEEKQDLAAKLVSSFVIFYGSGYIVKSWDPDSIYFLAEAKKDDCLRTHPYAMLVEQLTSPSRGVLRAVPDELEAESFRLLAKLLMEIKYGHELTNVVLDRDDEDDDDDDDDNGGRRGKNLQDVICDAMSRDLSYEEKAYLSAVEDCSVFQDRCRSLSRILKQRKHPGDSAAAARRLTHCNIIRGLRGLRPLGSKPASAQQSAVEAWGFAADSLQISSASGQLGLDIEQAPLLHDAAAGLPEPPQIASPMQRIGTTKLRVTFAEDNMGSLASTVGSTANAGGLFDDINGHEDSTKLRRFFSQIDQFRQESKEFIARKAVTGSQSKPARIAILDTGVDRSHGAIIAGFLQKRLREASCLSWASSQEGTEVSAAVHDTDGHGTNTTDLLLRVAPRDAQIFVAKIFDKREFSVQEAVNISKAIHHVVHEWGADIVTMSFGLENPTSQNGLGVIWTDIEKAIASAPNTIFLAAAGNHGRNAGRTFPARHHNVICVHASDGNGSEGRISPLPRSSDDNFMTLGMNIDFNVLVEQKRKTLYRSGTSYATPVAAGLVALLLPVLNAMDHNERSQTRARTGEGMKEIFRLMSESAPDMYRFVAPAVKLWTAGWHLDDRRMQRIECDINDALP